MDQRIHFTCCFSEGRQRLRPQPTLGSARDSRRMLILMVTAARCPQCPRRTKGSGCSCVLPSLDEALGATLPRHLQHRARLILQQEALPPAPQCLPTRRSCCWHGSCRTPSMQRKASSSPTPMNPCLRSSPASPLNPLPSPTPMTPCLLCEPLRTLQP